MQVYSPSSPFLTGPTVNSPGRGAFETRLALGFRMTDVAPVGWAVLSRIKDTGFWDWDRDWDCWVGMVQLKTSVAPGLTTPVGGSTDKSGGGNEGKMDGASSAKGKRLFFLSNIYFSSYLPK